MINASSQGLLAHPGTTASHIRENVYMSTGEILRTAFLGSVRHSQGGNTEYQGSVPTVCAVIANSYTAQLFCS